MNGENQLTDLGDCLEDSWDGNVLESIQEAENQALQTVGRNPVLGAPTRLEEDLSTGAESLPARQKTPQKRLNPCVFHGDIGGIGEEDSPVAVPARKKSRNSPCSAGPDPTLHGCERSQNQPRSPGPEADGSPDVRGEKFEFFTI